MLVMLQIQCYATCEVATKVTNQREISSEYQTLVAMEMSYIAINLMSV